MTPGQVRPQGKTGCLALKHCLSGQVKELKIIYDPEGDYPYPTERGKFSQWSERDTALVCASSAILPKLDALCRPVSLAMPLQVLDAHAGAD